MSECGVCIGGGYDSDGAYFGCKVVRSRKDRICEECGEIIPKGNPVNYHRGKTDEMWQAYICPVCDEIADALSCGGGRLFGTFWDSFWESAEGIGIACFEKLRTVEAKKELQRRWIEWKFSKQNRMAERRRIDHMLQKARNT